MMSCPTCSIGFPHPGSSAIVFGYTELPKVYASLSLCFGSLQDDMLSRSFAQYFTKHFAGREYMRLYTFFDSFMEKNSASLLLIYPLVFLKYILSDWLPLPACRGRRLYRQLPPPS